MDRLDIVITNQEIIKNDIIEVKERLRGIEIQDARQNAQLEEHMRRTAASEKRISDLEKLKWLIIGITPFLAVLLEILRRTL